jgi:hypothetical protein
MDLAAVRARLLQDRSLQFDFSAVPVQKPWREPKWLEAVIRFIANAISAALPVLKVLFWVGVAAAILTVLFLILREVFGIRFARARKATARVRPADWRPDAWKARALLEDADRLAAQGLYDAAARLILRRGIDDIDDRRPRLLRPGLTARDIAGLQDVPASARGAFSEIAAMVEASWFGGRPLGAEGFSHCRAAYEAFAFADGWA